MPLITARTIRYARAWLRGPVNLVEEDTWIDRDGTSIPATLVRPRKQSGPLPGWVAMHGITRPGRAHEQLVRFTRALASTGVVAIVPDVPEWRELDLAPHLCAPSVRAGIDGLRASGLVRDEPVGVMGFSFGAPHAIAATGHPTVKDDVAGSAGFGGYGDLERSFRFMMTGRHGWQGHSHHIRPDPYGRWIAGANYLTAVPDFESATDVAEALRSLACHAGDWGAPSWDPVYDEMIESLRGGVVEERRRLFDLFAPPSQADPDPDVSIEVADGLAAAARRVDPGIDPAPALATVERPVHILHGRRDHLIAFTEAHRLASALPASTASRVTITGLFGHSAQDPFPGFSALTEVPRLTRALSALFALA